MFSLTCIKQTVFIVQVYKIFLIKKSNYINGFQQNEVIQTKHAVPLYNLQTSTFRTEETHFCLVKKVSYVRSSIGGIFPDISEGGGGFSPNQYLILVLNVFHYQVHILAASLNFITSQIKLSFEVSLCDMHGNLLKNASDSCGVFEGA